MLESIAPRRDRLGLGPGQRLPGENRLLWDLAAAGRWEEAREVYRWYTPLLHLDTHVKLVQYIKLAEQECGLGSETVRAPRLPLERRGARADPGDHPPGDRDPAEGRGREPDRVRGSGIADDESPCIASR